MHSDAFVYSPAESARSTPPAEARTEAPRPPGLSEHFRDVLVRRMLKKPSSMPWVLATWGPSMEESAGLLRLLTEKMTLKWWIKRKPDMRRQILDELIRIDNGRGIIADWLALIVREENDLSVLQGAAEWASRQYRFTDRLLDAWYQRSLTVPSGTGSYTAQTIQEESVRRIALKVMVNAILPSTPTPPSGPVEGNAWNEERRAAIILSHLSEYPSAKRWAVEQMVKRLEIMANWKPSPELHGKKILSEIFHEWEKHIQNIANVPADSIERFIHQEYLRVTWKGLNGLSSGCADADRAATDRRLLSWVEYWLQCEKMLGREVVGEMVRWTPGDDAQREQLAVLWSKYLLSPGGYENPAVWEAVGRYVVECRRPGSGMVEICRNYLKALNLVAEKTNVEVKLKVMKTIVHPPWLTAEQQVDWKTLWGKLMSSSHERTVRVITRHLLGLVTAGMADVNEVKNEVKGIIMKKVKNMSKWSSPSVVHSTALSLLGMLVEIARWENERNFPGEMFYDVYRQMSNPPLWEIQDVRSEMVNMLLRNDPDPKVSLKEMAEILAAFMKENPVPGEAFPKLNGLALEILCKDVLYCSSLKEKLEIMNDLHDLHPAVVIKMLKDWGRDEKVWSRCEAWEFFSLLGDRYGNESGMFLVEWLRKENVPDVLYVMAQWKPSPGKPFPPGFREGWIDCFRRLVTVDTSESLTPGSLNSPNLVDRLDVVKCVIRTLTVSLLEEQPGSEGQTAKLADLQAFRETIEETIKSFVWREMPEDAEVLWGEMEALFQLTGPPEIFLKSFGKVVGTNVFYRGGDIWIDLLKTVASREMDSLPAHVRHNLGVVAASWLGNDMFNDFRDRMADVLLKLCGDGTWTPDRIPAGWEVFCRQLHRFGTKERNVAVGKLFELTMQEMCAMVRIGYSTRDERCRQLFQQTLFQVLESDKLESDNRIFIPVVESAVWYETARTSQMVERLKGDKNRLDRAGQQRWMREFLRSHEQTFREGKGGKEIQEFLHVLRVELEDKLFSREMRGDREKSQVRDLALDSREAVFVHPHRDGNCLAEVPDRLVGTEPVGQRVPRQSFFLTK